MKKTIASILIVLFTASIAYAGSLTYQQKRALKKQGYSDSDIRSIERGRIFVEPTYKYKSITGNRYQYDLSKLMDKMRYDLDIGAQLHDDLYMDIKPRVDIDRNFGQYGGGLQRD